MPVCVCPVETCIGPLVASASTRVRSLCPPKLLPEIGGTGAADRRLLLEEILLQLDGEICSILRRIADGSFVKNEAALASRLVCRRWHALGDHALATTLIRLRLLSRQVKAAMYTRFLVKSMPASAHQLQRSGRPDATAAQLASSQEEFMVAAYENCYSPVVITSADAAVELIRHLRKHGVHTPFVVFAAPKKLAA